MVSAVAFFAYALARARRASQRDGVAALAGLAPGGVYSVFIMEENPYYSAVRRELLAVLARAGLRPMARRGGLRRALGLTYFAKPLAVPLVAAYAGVVLLWALTELRARREPRDKAAALAVRLAPVAAFGAMLVVRHALTTRGADATQSGVVLGRFYSDELGGALLPPIKPFTAVVLSLAFALAFGVAIAPLVALLGGWRARIADRRRLWLAVLAIGVATVYVLAAARHTMVINRHPRIHERYPFAVGPLSSRCFSRTPPRSASPRSSSRASASPW